MQQISNIYESSHGQKFTNLPSAYIHNCVSVMHYSLNPQIQFFLNIPPSHLAIKRDFKFVLVCYGAVCNLSSQYWLFFLFEWLLHWLFMMYCHDVTSVTSVTMAHGHTVNRASVVKSKNFLNANARLKMKNDNRRIKLIISSWSVLSELLCGSALLIIS